MSPINHLHLGIALYLFYAKSAAMDAGEQAVPQTGAQPVAAVGAELGWHGGTACCTPRAGLYTPTRGV